MIGDLWCSFLRLRIWGLPVTHAIREGWEVRGLQLRTDKDLLPPLIAFEEAAGQTQVGFQGRSDAQVRMQPVVFLRHGPKAPGQLGNVQMKGGSCVQAHEPPNQLVVACSVQDHPPQATRFP